MSQILIAGIVYDVLHTYSGGLLRVRRPKGIKDYVARRLPDSPIFGENRGVLVAGHPFQEPKVSPTSGRKTL